MTEQDPTQPYQPPTAAPAPPPAAPPPPASGPTFAAPEPPAQAVGTTPVVTESGRKPGRSPVKWIVAALIAVLVVGGAAGATMLLTSNTTASSSAVEKWAPADAAAYYEVRLDLPGSQQAELAQFMSAFPGFDDQAAFPTKLGEIGDRIVRAATEDTYDYQTDIAPWFGGQIGVSQGVPPADAEMGSGALLAPTLAAVSVTDAAKATAWMDSVIAETNATTVTRDHNGTTITVVETGAEMGIDLPDYGYAVVGTVVLAGDVPSIEAAIDANGAGGLSTTPDYQAARAALPGDHIVFGYTEPLAALGALGDLGSLDPTGMAEGAAGIYEQLLPAWAATSLKAQDGRLVMESVAPHSTALGESANRVDPIAALAPAHTVVLATGSDVGARLQALKTLFAAEPAFEEVVGQIDQALGIVGGFESATGWIGDAGIAVTHKDGVVGGGVIIEPTDAAAAERLFTSLRSLIEVGAGGMLTFETEDYNGTTIVSLDLTELAGLGAGMGGLDVGMLPDEIDLALAVADDVVVLGVGPQFVKDVLDARAGASLADQARYTALIDAAGAENTGVMWLDIAALRGMVEPLLPADAAAAYERDLKPYVEPLDAIGGATVTSTDLDRTTVYLTVTE